MHEKTAEWSKCCDVELFFFARWRLYFLLYFSIQHEEIEGVNSVVKLRQQVKFVWKSASHLVYNTLKLRASLLHGRNSERFSCFLYLATMMKSIDWYAHINDQNEQFLRSHSMAIHSMRELKTSSSFIFIFLVQANKLFIKL